MLLERFGRVRWSGPRPYLHGVAHTLVDCFRFSKLSRGDSMYTIQTTESHHRQCACCVCVNDVVSVWLREVESAAREWVSCELRLRLAPLDYWSHLSLFPYQWLRVALRCELRVAIRHCELSFVLQMKYVGEKCEKSSSQAHVFACSAQHSFSNVKMWYCDLWNELSIEFPIFQSSDLFTLSLSSLLLYRVETRARVACKERLLYNMYIVSCENRICGLRLGGCDVGGSGWLPTSVAVGGGCHKAE